MIPLPIRQAGPVESPFNAEQQGRFDAGLQRAIAKYPPERGKAALLAALHLVQDELGWLPEPAMAYVAFRLDVPPARVREVATFYTMYRLRPVGRHHIGICNSVSCGRWDRRSSWPGVWTCSASTPARLPRTATSPSRKWPAWPPAETRRPCC